MSAFKLPLRASEWGREHILDAAGDAVAQAWMLLYDAAATDQHRRRAEIILAVNTHAALVDALRQAVEALEDAADVLARDGYDSAVSRWERDRDTALTAARAILAEIDKPAGAE